MEHKYNKEIEKLPIFEGKMDLPNDLKMVVKHRNYDEVLGIDILSSEGKKINLKNYLSLPEDVGLGIGSDFGIEKRRHFSDKLNIPDLQNFKKFEDINSPYDYLLLLFHECGHLNDKGLKAKERLEEFYSKYPGARNIFQLLLKAQSEALLLEHNSEIEAWKWGIKQIENIEKENNLKILPEDKAEIERLINLQLGTYKDKYKELVSRTNKKLFVFNLD